MTNTQKIQTVGVPRQKTVTVYEQIDLDEYLDEIVFHLVNSWEEHVQFSYNYIYTNFASEFMREMKENAKDLIEMSIEKSLWDPDELPEWIIIDNMLEISAEWLNWRIMCKEALEYALDECREDLTDKVFIYEGAIEMMGYADQERYTGNTNNANTILEYAQQWKQIELLRECGREDEADERASDPAYIQLKNEYEAIIDPEKEEFAL